MTRTLIVILLASFVLSSGCKGPEAVRGGEGTDNPELDDPAMGVGLDKNDLDYMVGEYTKALFDSRFWIREIEKETPLRRVAIWPIENATTQHLGDEMLMLLSSLETTLVNSGDVQVVARARQEELVRELGIQQGAAYDPATAQKLGKQLGVQYFLTGKLTSVDERLGDKRRVQYTLFIQVLELETGAIKFQYAAARTKGLKG